jgi:hypothetical protein
MVYKYYCMPFEVKWNEREPWLKFPEQLILYCSRLWHILQGSRRIHIGKKGGNLPTPHSSNMYILDPEISWTTGKMKARARRALSVLYCTERFITSGNVLSTKGYFRPCDLRGVHASPTSSREKVLGVLRPATATPVDRWFSPSLTTGKTGSDICEMHMRKAWERHLRQTHNG